MLVEVLCGTSETLPSRPTACNVHPFLHPDIWNKDMVAGAPVDISDPEEEGRILEKMDSELPGVTWAIL